MGNFTICVIGSDARQSYLADFLRKEGHTVHVYPEFQSEYLNGCDLLIGPVQFYQGTTLTPEIEAACSHYHVPVINYMASREFLLANAELTAEGLLAFLILNTPFSLNGATALILGFGRCGAAIAKKLHALGCRVDAYDLVPDSFENPQSYDLIINTIPDIIMTEEKLVPLRRNCCLFDIASSPGGFDKEAVSRLGMELHLCPHIPGKTAPQTAGYAIAQQVLSYLN